MYWIMDQTSRTTPEGEPVIEIFNQIKVPGARTWKSGRAFGVDLPTPIRIDFETLPEYDGPLPELRDLGVPLMSNRLARSLVTAGVDTLDLYDAVLRHRATGQEFGYKAFNVTLLLAAADMGRSRWQSYDGVLMYDVSFYGLVLDLDKCQGELLFRLGQNVNALLVHDSVRQAIVDAGIDTLKFIAPENWLQL